jgi:hypothetical protein
MGSADWGPATVVRRVQAGPAGAQAARPVAWAVRPADRGGLRAAASRGRTRAWAVPAGGPAGPGDTGRDRARRAGRALGPRNRPAARTGRPAGADREEPAVRPDSRWHPGSAGERASGLGTCPGTSPGTGPDTGPGSRRAPDVRADWAGRAGWAGCAGRATPGRAERPGHPVGEPACRCGRNVPGGGPAAGRRPPVGGPASRGGAGRASRPAAAAPRHSHTTGGHSGGTRDGRLPRTARGPVRRHHVPPGTSWRLRLRRARSQRQFMLLKV